MQEAIDFKEECEALEDVLSSLTETDFKQETLFKGWTIEDIIGHLHLWNHAAIITLKSREAFQNFFVFAMQRFGQGEGHIEMQNAWFDKFANGVRGKALFDLWRETYPILAQRYHSANPEMRLAWAGPDMNARSKIIARQMETWAHGQAIFDVLGNDRVDQDRLKNIAHLGVTTYSWTFKNRNLEPPKPKPFVDLTGPSGVKWTWNEPQDDNLVKGDATQFCQIVTQTRNIADADLDIVGESAKRWMEMAQCFAGAPIDPPAKGMRQKRQS